MLLKIQWQKSVLVSSDHCTESEEHTAARRMNKSSSANFLNTTNLIASLMKNRMIKMIMSSHVAMVMAVDLLSDVIDVARTANGEIEGRNILNLEGKEAHPPRPTLNERR